LSLSGDEHLWGKFDETEDRVVAHGSNGDGDVDLLDSASAWDRRGDLAILIEPPTP
jgi:hypothetical protein